MKLKKMNDEECLGKFLEFLEERVSINTGFISEGDNGILTHQVMRVECGDYTSYSQPEPLGTPLRVATAEETGQTIN